MIHSQGQGSSLGQWGIAVNTSLTAFKQSPFLTRVVSGNNELRVDLALTIMPGLHWINNAHHCVKAVSCSINYTRGNVPAL